MNKTAIKNYAIWARVQLIESAKQRAFEYEITENGENKSDVDVIGGRLLSNDEKVQRSQLIEQIRQKGYYQVMEEAAYTWFNRFIALRFMEVNGYLPSKVRVFTNESGAFIPEILKQAMSVEIDGLDYSKVIELLDKQRNEELYKYLLITQCNALNTGLPYMFEKIADWTELLFPINLLKSDSVLGRMISEIPEKDWTDAVQIIGWLYQYYNTELNDLVYDGSYAKNKITKELLPAATTIYTPDWPIRYMVENSLGRLWYEGHNDFNKTQWKYYLDETEQDPIVEKQLQKIRTEYSRIKPEEIRVIDPCMGSGHILVYAFDVLMQIYTFVGWSERDAAKSIIENNLYGLDIDDRAGQLAYFAVMMKARKYNRHILNGELSPNVLSIRDSNWMSNEFIAYIAGKNVNMREDLLKLRKTFRDAKEYGSILNVSPMNFDELYERIDYISRRYAEDLFQIQYQELAVEYLLPLVKQSFIMSQKYDIVVTNPPYLGNSRFSSKMDAFVKHYYGDVKADLSIVMYKKALTDYAKRNRYVSFITTSSWMFLSSFETMRTYQTAISHISSLVDFGTELFEGKVGHNPIVAWVTRTNAIDYKMLAIRLVDFCYSRRDEKEEAFFSINNRFSVNQKNFLKIPSNPIAYWVSDNFFRAFSEGHKIGDFSIVSEGIKTGNNERYLRLWHEIKSETFSFGESDNGYKWYPHHKGGDFRKWYGNLEWVINWENDGFAIRGASNSGLQGKQMYFKEFASWSKISSKGNPLRYYEKNILFDSGAPAIANERIKRCIALLNTVVGQYILNVISPTLNLQVGDIKSVPLLNGGEDSEDIVDRCIEISKLDWDSFETSWDFKKHPLI